MSITNSTFAVTDVSGLGVCGIAGSHFQELSLCSLSSPCRVDGKLRMGSLHGNFFVGDHQLLAVKLKGLRVKGAAVETTHESHLRRKLARLDSEHRALSASSTGSTVERGGPISVD